MQRKYPLEEVGEVDDKHSKAHTTNLRLVAVNMMKSVFIHSKCFIVIRLIEGVWKLLLM